MDLYGWNYEGRQVNQDFHWKARTIIELLSNPSFVKGRTYGVAVQEEIGKELGGLSGGTVRTIKRMMEQLGIIYKDALHRKVPDPNYLLTEQGQLLFPLVETEIQLSRIDPNDPRKLELQNAINQMYRSFYSKIMYNYYFPNGGRGESGRLHLLRAVLKALRKYKSLDYWEWYLLNTFITEDDNIHQEKDLDTAIQDYRDKKAKGDKPFDKKRDKPKKYELSHSYIVSYLEYGGFVKIVGTGDSWRIVEGNHYSDIKEKVLENDFLKNFYINSEKGSVMDLFSGSGTSLFNS